MVLNFDKKEGSLLLSLQGRLDTTTAPDLETFIDENLDGITQLTVNCEKLEYVSSAGLRVLLTAQKKMKGAMKITNVQELVMEVFEMTGFADILVIE